MLMVASLFIVKIIIYHYGVGHFCQAFPVFGPGQSHMYRHDRDTRKDSSSHPDPRLDGKAHGRHVGFREVPPKPF